MWCCSHTTCNVLHKNKEKQIFCWAKTKIVKWYIFIAPRQFKAARYISCTSDEYRKLQALRSQSASGILMDKTICGSHWSAVGNFAFTNCFNVGGPEAVFYSKWKGVRFYTGNAVEGNENYADNMKERVARPQESVQSGKNCTTEKLLQNAFRNNQWGVISLK